MNPHGFRPLLPSSSLLASSVTYGDAPVHQNQRIRNRGAPQRRHHHTDSDWEKRKETISQLYLVENKSVEDVVKSLSEDHEFYVRYALLDELASWMTTR